MEGDGEIRESAGRYPWLSAFTLDGGFWQQEAEDWGSGGFSFLIVSGHLFPYDKLQGPVVTQNFSASPARSHLGF